MAAPVAAQSPPDPAAEGLGLLDRLDLLVERVKYEQKQIETLEARLVQHLKSDLRVEEEVSRGWFRYRPPDALRWEFEEPKPIVMTVRDDVSTIWFVDLGTAQVTDVGRVSEQVLTYMGPAGSLETLMKYFTVEAQFPEEEGDDYYLHLTADYRRVEKYATTIDLWIDPVTFLPRSFKVVNGAGDERLIHLEDMVLNEPIDEDQFVLELPEDVEVTKVEINR